MSEYVRHIGVVPRFKPRRDRTVHSKAVPCPICGAVVGQMCLKQDGTPGVNIHKRRRRLAYEAGH